MLAARARAGDLAALSGLLRRWQEPMRSFCRRLTGHEEDANDLAQDTLLRATKGLAAYDPDRPFAPWIYRIARNACLNHLEKQRVRAAAPPRRGGRSDPPPDVLVARREEVLRVRRALMALGAEDRRLLTMKLVRGLGNDEIARRLGVSRGALRTRACRALARLRAALDGETEVRP